MTIWITFLVLISLGAASAENHLKDGDEKAELSLRIRSLLWDITGRMRAGEEDEDLRVCPVTQLSSGRWVKAEARHGELNSPWPAYIKLTFYEGSPENLKVVEEIVDYNLDGFTGSQSKDAYFRYAQNDYPDNILESLDPRLLEPVNQEYATILSKLEEALGKGALLNEAPAWRTIHAGIELTQYKVNKYIRFGPSEVVAVRFEPEKYDLVPYSYREKEFEKKMSINGWAESIPDALVLINSGQFYPDDNYIGLQIKNGVNLGTKIHPNWKAFLLSGGKPGDLTAKQTVIVDSNRSAIDPENTGYRYILQSFMLLDKNGVPRVKKTRRLASRTVIAEDGQGRMLVFFVPGACTLYELALLIKESNLSVQEAMCMDGGFEAQIYVRKNSGDLVLFGSWVVNEEKQYNQNLFRLPLPAVLALMPVVHPTQ